MLRQILALALIIFLFQPRVFAETLPEIESRDAVSEEVDTKLPLPPLEEINNDSDTPARSVRLEFQKSEGALAYEIEVTQDKRSWAEPLSFQIPSSEILLRLRLSPGQYQVKTRSIVDRVLKSNWTYPKNFWVGFRPIEKAFPAPGETINPKGNEIEVLVLEWPKEENATAYIVQIRDASGKFLRNAVLTNTWLKTELPVNGEYQWRVIPLAAKEDAARILKQKNPKSFSKFKIGKPDENMRKTEFAIGAMAKAEKYEFEVVSIGPDNNPGQPSYFYSYEPKFLGRLPPGQYELRVRAKTGESNSDWSAPSNFFVEHFEPPAITATKSESIEPTDDEASKVLLKWQKYPQASFYRVFVFDEKDALLFESKTEATEVTVKLPHQSKYKWYAKPYSAREPASDAPDAKKATNDFSITNYIKLALSSAEESSQFYSWLRFLSSQESYTGSNYDNNALVKQKLLGGETELAIGYWFRKMNIGLLATTNNGGFRFRGTTYNYISSSFLVGYRHLLDNGDRWRLWLGMSQKENPEILTNPFTTDVQFSKVTSNGPIAQFAYLHAINQNWGTQYWGSWYQSQSDRGTPNGLPQEPRNSYRFGVLVSYTGIPDQRWCAGYTYKVENFAYGTTDPIGSPNTGKLEGHYLSLMLEIALAEKMK